jgi:NAD(P)H-hydrate epimerase
MREVDRLLVDELGISLARLMENAGRNLALLARELLGGDATGASITVLAGSGGNGGGGLAAARHLVAAGARVEIALSAEELSPATAEQLAILRRMRVPEGTRTEPDLVLDALLGYGQRGAPRGEAARLIEWSASRRVLALDVPSGLELSSGTLYEPHVRAEATLTLALPKEGLRAAAAATATGRLFIADLSVPPLVYDRLGLEYRSPFGRGTVVPLFAFA